MICNEEDTDGRARVTADEERAPNYWGLGLDLSTSQ